MNEIDNLYLGQALLDAAMAARAEYEKASSDARYYMDNVDCFHPPLTKKGKHDKRIFCNDCWELHNKANSEAQSLYYQWNGAWGLLDELKGEAQ